jgi:sulfur-oxidizing protein SoxY
MPHNRRTFLKNTALLTVSAWLHKPSVHAQMANNFVPDVLDGVATSDIIDTDKIDIKLPKIAEKGAAVPITVSSSLDNIRTISLWVEKNPIPLVAIFRLSSQLEAFVSARLTMVETSDVIVLVETRDAVYRAKEQVKIIIGGCGT